MTAGNAFEKCHDCRVAGRHDCRFVVVLLTAAGVHHRMLVKPLTRVCCVCLCYQAAHGAAMPAAAGADTAHERSVRSDHHPAANGRVERYDSMGSAAAYKGGPSIDSAASDTSGAEDDKPLLTLYVGNLAAGVEESVLYSQFVHFGAVTNVQVIVVANCDVHVMTCLSCILLLIGNVLHTRTAELHIVIPWDSLDHP